MLQDQEQTSPGRFGAARARALSCLLLGIAAAVAILFTLTAARKVSIMENGRLLTMVVTGSTDAKVICETAGIPVQEEDEIRRRSLGGDQFQLYIRRAFDVTVRHGNETRTARVTGGTVADVFRTLGLSTDANDIVSASLSDRVTANMHIDLITVDYETVVTEETIAADLETRYTSDLPSGETQLVAGSDGVKRVTCSLKTENGVLAEQQILSEEVITAPVNAVNLVGTGRKTQNTARPASAPAAGNYDSVRTVSNLQPGFSIELDANNRPVHYQKVLTGQATAYSGGGVTATGKRVQVGYVAVDPREIPYGSQLYIISSDGSIIYGYAVAEDTGGFIHNSNTLVDLYYSTEGECIRFGRRNVEVYLLD